MRVSGGRCEASSNAFAATAGPRVAVVGFNDPIRYRVIGGRGGQKYHFVDIMKAAADVMEVAGILKKRPTLADIATNDFLPK